ncbi:hypothetical protein [Legionella hackeliae]|nr:hypothetical protein [Legionella hackeliae]
MDRSNNEVEILFEIYSGRGEKACLITYFYNGKSEDTEKALFTEYELFYQCELPETAKSHKRIYKINRITGRLRNEISNGAVNTGLCKKSERKF